MKISCVCIVKNGEETLDRCLKSVKSITDEYIVVDTGSTDNTKEIIKKYGKVYELPFEDFVVTKNKALELATGDYILFMDADEYMTDGINLLKEYAESGVNAVSSKITEGNDGRIINVYNRIRLWKNKGYVFGGCGVHEVIQITDNYVIDNTIKTHHDHRYKKHIPEQVQDRFLSYVEILKKHLSQNPEATRERFYLARTYRDLGWTVMAITEYQKYLNLKNLSFRDEIYQAYYDIAICYKSQGEYKKSLKNCNKAIDIDDRRAEAYNLKGLLYYLHQDWNKAIENYETALSKSIPDDVTLFLNPEEYGKTPADYLSICYNGIKQYRKAEEFCKLANSIEPTFTDERILSNLQWFKRKTQMNIFMTLGHTPEKVYGGIIDETGVGGVETSYIELAQEFAGIGHKVYLFCYCDKKHVYNGVRYIPYNELQDYNSLQPDVVITSRWFESLNFKDKSNKIIWLQDNITFNEILSKVDGIVCSSEWHKNYLAEQYGHHINISKIKVIPLSIRKDLFSVKIKRDQKKVFYSSSPDRGLDILLGMWEKITKECPGINLHIYYGWNTALAYSTDKLWEDSVMQGKQDMYNFAKKFDNITFHGRLTKEKLAKEMLSASLCLYPNNFWETFCITGLETQTAGVPMITTNKGALETTLGDGNVLIDYEPYSKEYEQIYIKEVKRLFLNKEEWKEYSKKCTSHRIETWNEISLRWEKFIWEIDD